MVAHRAYPAGRAGCRWLMSAAATAGLASGRWRPSPDLALARWAWRPRIATRALGADPGSVRTARDFTVATPHQRVMAERSPDIAIVAPELMANALRHAPPGSGDTRPRQPIRLGLLQPGPCVLCAVADRARPLRRRERPAPSTRPAADCTSSARSATSGTAPRPARRKGRAGPVRPAAPVPEQTRPRPVAEPGSLAEPASVNDPSPVDARTRPLVLTLAFMRPLVSVDEAAEDGPAFDPFLGEVGGRLAIGRRAGQDADGICPGRPEARIAP